MSVNSADPIAACVRGGDQAIFADAGPGKTKLTVLERVTKSTEKAAFALAGMEEGFRQTLGKLDAYLAKH